MFTLKRYIVMLAVCAAGFLIQTMIFPFIKLGSVMPNIIIVIVSCYGFLKGHKEGMFTGFCCGMFYDIFFAENMGVYALIFVTIGYLNAYIHETIGDYNRRLPIYFILGSDLAYGIISYIFFFLLRGKFVFGYCLLNIIIPELIYTAVFAFPVFVGIRTIERKFMKSESRSANRFV